MHDLILGFIRAVLATALSVGLIAALLTSLPRMGAMGRELSEAFTKAPLLDLWVASLTWVPWVVACVGIGWTGIFAAILGQMIAMGIWCFVHEMMHRDARRGPRIVKFLNRTVGRWRN